MCYSLIEYELNVSDNVTSEASRRDLTMILRTETIVTMGISLA